MEEHIREFFQQIAIAIREINKIEELIKKATS